MIPYLFPIFSETMLCPFNNGDFSLYNNILLRREGTEDAGLLERPHIT